MPKDLQELAMLRLFADLAVMPAVMSHERSKTGREVIWLIYCILEAADGHLRIRPKSDNPILLLPDTKNKAAFVSGDALQRGNLNPRVIQL